MKYQSLIPHVPAVCTPASLSAPHTRTFSLQDQKFFNSRDWPAEGLGPRSVRWAFCLTQLLEQHEVVRNCPPKQPCCCGKPGCDCTPGPSEQSQQHPQAKAPGAGLPPAPRLSGEQNETPRCVKSGWLQAAKHVNGTKIEVDIKSEIPLLSGKGWLKKGVKYFSWVLNVKPFGKEQ